MQAPQRWPAGDDWRPVYNYIGPENREALWAEGEARRARQARDKSGIAAQSSA